MKKLLLTDCDGTLREPASGEKFIQHPLDQKIIDGADRALAHYYKEGWIIVAISNQAGVEAGYKSLEDAIAESHYTLELFPQILCLYICPDFQGKHCWLIGRKHDEVPVHTTDWGEEFIGSFRKPQPGMLGAAIKISGFKEQKSEYWYVGDRPEDEEAGMRAGVNFMPSDIWLNRFRPGIYLVNATPKQIEFLEGIELKGDTK